MDSEVAGSLYDIDSMSNPPREDFPNFSSKEKCRSNSILIRKLVAQASERVLASSCWVDVNLTFGPSSRRAPGSYGASRVCLRRSKGCRRLDLPELLAPARSVRGAISTRLGSTNDLKPPTERAVRSRRSVSDLGLRFGLPLERSVIFGLGYQSLGILRHLKWASVRRA